MPRVPNSTSFLSLFTFCHKRLVWICAAANSSCHSALLSSCDLLCKYTRSCQTRPSYQSLSFPCHRICFYLSILRKELCVEAAAADCGRNTTWSWRHLLIYLLNSHLSKSRKKRRNGWSPPSRLFCFQNRRAKTFFFSFSTQSQAANPGEVLLHQHSSSGTAFSGPWRAHAPWLVPSLKLHHVYLEPWTCQGG